MGMKEQFSKMYGSSGDSKKGTMYSHEMGGGHHEGGSTMKKSMHMARGGCAKMAEGERIEPMHWKDPKVGEGERMSPTSYSFKAGGKACGVTKSFIPTGKHK